MPVQDLYFSSSYEEAQDRFVQSANKVGARMFSYPVAIEGFNSNDLTIDVAIVGYENAPTLVTSSGVHGVEGFLGSAIQLAKLGQLTAENTNDFRWVFIHALNPFGFSRLRRFNEANIDLNRNFLLSDSQYSDASDGYRRLNGFLNPTTAPSRFEPFRIKAIWHILRYGMASLKQSIAEGQYEFPRGIFFGGAGPSQSMKLVAKNAEDWFGGSKKILHVDFHSGLGRLGSYKLLLSGSIDASEYSWLAEVFGRKSIEAWDEGGVSGYQASGTFGDWLKAQFADADYRFVTAEFGTYGPIRVLAAIRAENRAHHFGSPKSRIYKTTKQELLECFCPSNSSWRQRVVDSGLAILSQAAEGLRRA